MNRPLFLTIVLFVLAELLLGWWIWSDTERENDRDLQHQLTELETGFDSVVQGHEKLIEMTLHHLVSHRDLLPLMEQAIADPSTDNLSKVRGRLYRLMYRDYQKLLKSDVRVIQFVLPDGRSLLRFNRPDLFGDDIAADRPLLAQVLSTETRGMAFENGRVYPGFRYVFPLMKDGKLLGAADFSLSFDGIRREFEKTDQTTGSVSTFLLRKDLLEAVTHPSATDLFESSPLNSDFVIENPDSPLKDIFDLSALPDWVSSADRILSRSQPLKAAMEKGMPFGQPVCAPPQGCFGVALQPVVDSAQRTAGYIAAYTPMPEFSVRQDRALASFLGGTLLILIISTLFTRWIVSRNRLHTISQHMGEGMYVVDRQGRIIYTNPATSQILGYPVSKLVGANAHELFHAECDGKELSPDECPIRNRALEGETYSSDRKTFRCKDGNLIRVAVTSSPMRENGVVNGAVVLFRDISLEYENQRRLLQANTALRQLAEGVVITDVDNRIVAVNQAFTSITGYAEGEVLGETPAILRSDRHDDAFYESLWLSLKELGFWEGEMWNRRKGGVVYPEWLKITVLKDEKGQHKGYVAVFSDITDKLLSEQRLEHLAYRDQLTGLHNRTSFQEITLFSLKNAARRNRKAALLFLDLDRFKRINDTFGHVAGDSLLKQVADRLKRRLRERDSIARIGGDEFTILLEEGGDEDRAVGVAEKVLEVLREPFHFETKRLDVTGSIGISIFPDDGEDGDALMKNADAAMYQAKQHGRDRFHRFEKGMDHLSLKKFELEQSLRDALNDESLTLFYQPKVALPSGRLIGLEALVRWQHPERGLLTPFHFLDVAEEAGLMQQLTELVIKKASAQCAEWVRAGYLDTRVAVNLDSQFLQRTDAVATLVEIAEQQGIQPSNLELEIVETGILRADQHSVLWKQLADLGFVVSIDDFGTGESSLSRLKSIPVNILKIDQSFVRDLEHDEDDRAIVHTIIAMANTLGKDVIAEGVENEAQLRFLYASGCRAIQGYYFARPVSAQQAGAFLQTGYFGRKAAAVMPQSNVG